MKILKGVDGNQQISGIAPSPTSERSRAVKGFVGRISNPFPELRSERPLSMSKAVISDGIPHVKGAMKSAALLSGGANTGGNTDLRKH